MKTKVARVLLVGFGSIGQALAPLLRNSEAFRHSRIHAIAADDRGVHIAHAFGIEHQVLAITPDTLHQALSPLLSPGDLLINVSVNVSSAALILWCGQHGVLYLDTCVEPWAGGYLGHGESSLNARLRASALKLRGHGSPTAVIAHGANPGLITHLVKEALLAMSTMQGLDVDQSNFAAMAQRLGIKVVQIAERDTQTSDDTALPGPGQFLNTWSADGLVSEAWQHAELGWGSHETQWPTDAHVFQDGRRLSVYLDGHSVQTRVRSWVPSSGPQQAYLITHHEALSIAEHLSVHKEGRKLYSPTVYYAYQPCPAATRSLQLWSDSGFSDLTETRVMRDELTTGCDELGALLIFEGGAFWYGSTVHLHEARALAPFNTATSIQVVAGILGALSWMLEHPCKGVVEAEDMDHQHVMRVARPWLGEVKGHMTPWQPTHNGDLTFNAFRVLNHRKEIQ